MIGEKSKNGDEFEMSQYRLDISYDGSEFVGFQTQPSNNSVQDHIEKALGIFFSEKLKLTGASRTDSGVHAENQVGVFSTARPFDERKWLRGFNSLTPRAIGIMKIQKVSNDFHPIRSAKGKAYRYRLWRGNCWNPFIFPYVWEVHKPIDMENLKKSAHLLVGLHDFTSFCNTDTDISTKTRRILEIRIEERGPLIDFWIVGEGFLKQMVRIIVGTLIDIAEGRLPKDSMNSILTGKDRNLAGVTAPAGGLALVKIFYDKVLPIQHLMDVADRSYSQST